MIENKLLTHLNGKRLANPIDYEIHRVNRHWYEALCNLTRLIGWGKTGKRAKKDLLLHLDFMSSSYLNLPDEKLTKDAKGLKQKLLHHFGPEFVEVKQ